MLSHARVLCNRARELLARATLKALDPCLLQRPLACSWRLLSKSTAVFARSLILESAQHELEHLAVIARVYVSLCVFSLSLSLSTTLYLGLALRLSFSLSTSLFLRLFLSLSYLCVFFGQTPRLGLRLHFLARLSRSSFSLSLSSLQFRLYWSSRQKPATTALPLNLVDLLVANSVNPTAQPNGQPAQTNCRSASTATITAIGLVSSSTPKYSLILLGLGPRHEATHFETCKPSFQIAI